MATAPAGPRVYSASACSSLRFCSSYRCLAHGTSRVSVRPVHASGVSACELAGYIAACWQNARGSGAPAVAGCAAAPVDGLHPRPWTVRVCCKVGTAAGTVDQIPRPADRAHCTPLGALLMEFRSSSGRAGRQLCRPSIQQPLPDKFARTYAPGFQIVRHCSFLPAPELMISGEQ